MNIEAFMLCDAATDQMGKLNVLGAFDSIQAHQFPVVHPACAVALRLRFSPLEKGDHQIDICFLDADGKEVIPTLHANVHIAIPPSQTSAVINLVLNLQGVKFTQPGEYAVTLEIDGEEKNVIPLFLKYV
jgi:hypothetical protein